MEWNVLFFVNSVLLGVGLTMDAFSVSLANGLNEPKMRKKKMCGVAGVYAFFQALMPMTGWICVHTIVQYFRTFEKFIPWIALILLLYIGGKMLWDGFRNDEEEEKPGVGAWALFVQGVATSIDALSVGFTIAEYDFFISGLAIGKRFGTRFAGKATILGGIILIVIGLEIFIAGVF